MTLLSVERVAKSFRGLRAVDDVSFSVAEREIVALIGPNGAGKTTTFNLIAGAMTPDAGTIVMDGRRLHELRPDQACRAGIGRTFQIVRPFGQMSVRDNVIVGALRAWPSVAAARKAADEVLALLELDPLAERAAASLTLPERKRLEVARALATKPRLLLLDEVMAGLRPTEVDRLVATLHMLNASTGLTILLIEHVMRAVMALAQRVVVLHHGQLISQGTPAEIARDPKVIESYLGEAAV